MLILFWQDAEGFLEDWAIFSMPFPLLKLPGMKQHKEPFVHRGRNRFLLFLEMTKVQTSGWRIRTAADMREIYFDCWKNRQELVGNHYDGFTLEELKSLSEQETKEKLMKTTMKLDGILFHWKKVQSVCVQWLFNIAKVNNRKWITYTAPFQNRLKKKRHIQSTLDQFIIRIQAKRRKEKV